MSPTAYGAFRPSLRSPAAPEMPPSEQSSEKSWPVAASFSGPGICAAPRWSIDEPQKVNAVTKGAH